MSITTGTGTKGSKFEKLIAEGSILTEYIPFRNKKANNFKWAEECADYIGSLYSPLRDENRLRKYKINYDLANGRGDNLHDLLTPINVQKIDEEVLNSGTTPIRHVPVINQIYDAMIGEQMQASLKFTAVDSSGYSTNMRQKKRLELNQEWLKANILGPIQEQEAMRVMMENGITQQSQLSPDEQQDLFADVENRVKFRLVSDIDKFMSKDYRTPVETEVQKLVNWLVKHCDVKYVTDENFKNVIIMGMEIYRIVYRNNNIKLEIVNPAGFWCHSSANKLFVDESDIIINEQSITYADIINWHGTELYNSKYKDDLDKIRHNTMPKAAELNRIMSSQSGPFILQQAPPINTPEGQQYARAIATVFGDTTTGNKINYCHYVWKSFSKLKAITRKNKQGGLETFYTGENYEFNPMKGDVDESIEIVPDLYQTTKIGHNIYVEKGQLPYQYRSRANPFDVRMNYVGCIYNTLGGNSENVSPIDLGKPWQHKINVQMAKIEDEDRKNIGNVLVFPKKGRSTNTTWGQWMNLLKNENLLIYDDTGEGMSPSDIQAIRAIEMGNMSALQQRLPYLEFLRNQMALSMGFNPSRLGMQNPNLSVTNNKQNIVQSTLQTEYIYRTHNKVIENLINNLVNISKIYLKDNPLKTSYILDDMSIAELQLDYDLIDIAEQNVYVDNTIETQRTIERLTQLAQPLISSGQMDFEDAVKLEFARNGADIVNIAQDAIRKNDARMQQKYEMDAQAAQQQAQQQSEMAREIELMRHQMALEKQKLDNDMKLLIATVDSQKFANQWDIDKSGLNDQYEMKLKDIEFKREELQKMIEQAEKDRRQDKDLKMEELRVKREQIRKQRTVKK